MRKAIQLLLIIAWSVATYGQAGHKRKTKTHHKKAKISAVHKVKPVAVEKAVPAIDKNKAVTPKDTLKTEPVATEPEIKVNDTVIVATGKFRLYKKSAHASYYADKFNGKRTSSGKRFDNNKYSAAHRTFPFGTILRITNDENGKSVLVEVLDRGPFSRGREIDLSKKAFMEIVTNKNSGSTNVKIEVMD